MNGGSAETPNTITTITDGSIGVYAASAGIVNINGTTTISTGTTGETPTGANAYGVEANGLGSQVNLNGATMVTTLGTGAYGLDATAGGAIGATTDAPPAIGVATSGSRAIGVYASGVDLELNTPSTITIGGVASIITNGDTAAGVQADGGGAVTLGAGSVATNGADFPGVVATGAGSMVTLNGTSLLTVTTITDSSIGLQAASGGVIDATGPLTISTGSTGDTERGQRLRRQRRRLGFEGHSQRRDDGDDERDRRQWNGRLRALRQQRRVDQHDGDADRHCHHQRNERERGLRHRDGPIAVDHAVDDNPRGRRLNHDPRRLRGRRASRPRRASDSERRFDGNS